MRVVEITAVETHPLRTAVLRDNDPSRSVDFPDDDGATTFHLGVLADDGALVAISSWIPRPLVLLPALHAIQLRGMATAADRQGSGVGGTLFETGVAHCAALGYELLWANARDTALAFYEQHGCEVVGDGYVDATTQLPHHVVIRHLSGGRAETIEH